MNAINNENELDGLNILNNNPVLDLKNEQLYGTLYKDFLHDFSPAECKYYNETQIKSTLNSYNFDYISFFSINVQSILSKYNNLCNFIDSITFNKSRITAIFLQEIWCSIELNFEGYDYYFKSRTIQRGGGIALLINNEIQSELIEDAFFEEGIFEAITCKIIIDGEETILSSIYHPPNRTTAIENRFLEILNEYLGFLSSFNLPVVFGGDLNANYFQIQNLNSLATKVFEHLSFDGFISPITKATRVTLNSNTLIDIIGSKNLIQNLVLNGVCCSYISDHLIPFQIFKTTKNSTHRKPPEYFTKRAMTPAKLEQFKTSLANQDWSSVLNENEDVNLAFANFLSIFLDLFNIHIPKQKVKYNKRTMPMVKHMTKGLLKSRLKKQKLYTKFLSSRTPESWENFRIYRNLYNKLCRKAKIIKVREEVREAEGNSKQLWEVLKTNMGLSKKETKIEYLLDGERKITDTQDMANLFNKHLSNIGPELTKEVPKVTKSFKDYLGPRSDRNFYFFPISEYQLSKYISRMSPKKSVDVNGISISLINQVKLEILKPYCHIINISFKKGVMPSLTKVSRTIIIHKGGATHLLDCYRGVSLINSFGKIHEKVVYNKLLNFLDTSDYFAARQFGFRAGRSTFHAILDLTNRLTKVLASGKVAMAILLDVKKCFDVLDRNVLLSKLEHYGIRGIALDFFKSYFENREQKVFFKGTYSTTLEQILWGVMQGSILGVLLFLVYINDFQNCSNDLLSFLFADDNVIELEADNLSSLIDIANDQIPKVIEWYSSNKLILHPRKTKVMIFGLGRQLRFINENDLGLLRDFPVFFNTNSDNENIPEKIIKLNTVPNESENSVRHLGVFYDNELSFKFHCKHVYAKVSKIVFSLNQMKNILDQKHLKILYSSYIKSNIDYCNALLVGVPDSYINPIIKLQKKCVRIISGTSRLAHTAELFRNLRILPYDKLIKFNACKFMFDYKHGRTPSVFENTWKTNGDIRGRNLRNDDDYNIPFVNRSYLQNLPLFKFPALWNALPHDLKIEENRKQFLSKLQDHFINSIND